MLVLDGEVETTAALLVVVGARLVLGSALEAVDAARDSVLLERIDEATAVLVIVLLVELGAADELAGALEVEDTTRLDEGMTEDDDAADDDSTGDDTTDDVDDASSEVDARTEVLRADAA